MRNLKADESSKYLICILQQGKQSRDKAWVEYFDTIFPSILIKVSFCSGDEVSS